MFILSVRGGGHKTVSRLYFDSSKTKVYCLSKMLLLCIAPQEHDHFRLFFNMSHIFNRGDFSILNQEIKI